MCAYVCVLLSIWSYTVSYKEFQSVLVENGTIARCGAIGHCSWCHATVAPGRRKESQEDVARNTRGTRCKGHQVIFPAPGRPWPCNAPTLPENKAVQLLQRLGPSLSQLIIQMSCRRQLSSKMSKTSRISCWIQKPVMVAKWIKIGPNIACHAFWETADCSTRTLLNFCANVSFLGKDQGRPSM